MSLKEDFQALWPEKKIFRPYGLKIYFSVWMSPHWFARLLSDWIWSYHCRHPANSKNCSFLINSLELQRQGAISLKRKNETPEDLATPGTLWVRTVAWRNRYHSAPTRGVRASGDLRFSVGAAPTTRGVVALRDSLPDFGLLHYIDIKIRELY